MIKILQFFTKKFYVRGLPNILFRSRRIFLGVKRSQKDPDGIPINIDVDNYFQHNIVYGYYEPDVRSVINEILSTGDIFVDIGANIGYLTAVAASRVGAAGRVFAFEPNPEVFHLLTDNVKLNTHDNVQLVNMAASDTVGFATLYCGVESALSTLQENTGLLQVKTTAQVATVRVDDFLRSQNIELSVVKLIKIDTEGHEFKVLQGLKETLSLGSASFVIENNYIAQKTLNVNFQRICEEFFFCNGYMVYWIESKEKGKLFYRQKTKLTRVTAKNVAEFNEKNGDYLCLPNDIKLSMPRSGRRLVFGHGFVFDPERHETKFKLEGNVLRFLKKTDDFYEGAYLNRIKFKPRREVWPMTIPLWILACGYIWRVRKTFRPGALLLELGCAGGVDYFGDRFKMIGLDLSFKSLSQLNGYQLGIQASATEIPLADHSVDGIISSFFWEHISAKEKDQMLKEFFRILKPEGKILFLYDVETKNGLISKMKNIDIGLYRKLFLEKDGHIGYHTVKENGDFFAKSGFKVVENFGLERTWLQSNSVYVKMGEYPGVVGLFGRMLTRLTRGHLGTYFNSLLLRIVDSSVGKMFPIEKARMVITVVIKESTGDA